MKESILIDINHPSQVHVFKHFYWDLSDQYDITVTVKDDPASIKLLEILKVPYIFLGSKSDSILGKAKNQISYNRKVFQLIKKKKIKYGLGTSVTINQLSKVTGMISFFWDDDDSKVQPITRLFANPFADFIITPECLAFENYGKKHITYPGYHELAYLHPKRFNPDPSILELLGVKKNEPYFILRFNAFKAHHDIGIKGISKEVKRQLVQYFSSKGKVFITTESEIDPEFKKYQFNLPQDKMHSALFYATMLLGDSQTMTSEAAMLCTPSIRNNSFVGRIAYLEELEKKYQLTFGFLPEQTQQMFEKIHELMAFLNLKKEWKNRQEKMLKERIDVTAFMKWIITNYPDSIKQCNHENLLKLFN